MLLFLMVLSSHLFKSSVYFPSSHTFAHHNCVALVEFEELG